MTPSVRAVIIGYAIGVGITWALGFNTDPIGDIFSGAAMLISLWFADALKVAEKMGRQK